MVLFSPCDNVDKKYYFSKLTLEAYNTCLLSRMATWGEKELEMRDGSIILDMVDDEMLKFIQKCFTTEFCLRNVDFDNKIAHFSQFLNCETSFSVSAPHFPLVRKIIAVFDYLNIAPIFIAKVSMFEFRMDLRNAIKLGYLGSTISLSSNHLYISNIKMTTIGERMYMSSDSNDVYIDFLCTCRIRAHNVHRMKCVLHNVLFSGAEDKYYARCRDCDKSIMLSSKYEKSCDNFSLMLNMRCNICEHEKKHVIFAVEKTVCDFGITKPDIIDNSALMSIFALNRIL